VALRTLLRHRAQLVEHRSLHIQHIQKVLLQRNIQLSQAVTDVMGMTGQLIMRAIVAGIRNPGQLATLRDPGCKHTAEEIEKELTGTCQPPVWNEAPGLGKRGIAGSARQEAELAQQKCAEGCEGDP
jgi:hypothetical protein